MRAAQSPINAGAPHRMASRASSTRRIGSPTDATATLDSVVAAFAKVTLHEMMAIPRLMNLEGSFVLREFGADGAWRLRMPGGERQRLPHSHEPACGITQARRVQLIGGSTVRVALLEH